MGYATDKLLKYILNALEVQIICQMHIGKTTFMMLFCLFGQEQREHPSKYLLLFSTEERKVWNYMRASQRLARIFHFG